MNENIADFKGERARESKREGKCDKKWTNAEKNRGNNNSTFEERHNKLADGFSLINS
jgi:hypothetical protein